MELDATLRIWMGSPKEEFCANAAAVGAASTSVLSGKSVAGPAPPLASSPPVPSAAAINRILPIGCCCCWRGVGTMRLCIGIVWGAGWLMVVASKAGFMFCCCTVLIVIRGWTWRRDEGGAGGGGGELDLWLTISVSVLMTCTRGGGEEVVDEREWRNWRVFSPWGEWIVVAGGDGLTRFTTVEVVMGSGLLWCCSNCKADVFITRSGCPWWCWWVDPFVSCEGTGEMRRIACPPATDWITFIGAWGVWPLLREMPFAVIGIKLGALLGVAAALAAWKMLTGVPPLTVGRTVLVGAWINVGWLLLPVCTKLTAPPTWPAVVNIIFWPVGKVTICPWLWWGVNIFAGAQMLTGLCCSLGLVTAVVPARHICFGDGSSMVRSGFKLRFRFTAGEKKMVGNVILIFIAKKLVI